MYICTHTHRYMFVYRCVIVSLYERSLPQSRRSSKCARIMRPSCIRICICTSHYLFVYVYIYTCINIYTHTHTHIYIYTLFMYARMFISLSLTHTLSLYLTLCMYIPLNLPFLSHPELRGCSEPTAGTEVLLRRFFLLQSYRNVNVGR